MDCTNEKCKWDEDGFCDLYGYVIDEDDCENCKKKETEEDGKA